MRRRIEARVSGVFLGVAGAALVLAAGASADKPTIHLTAAGQAAARATVLRKADLGTTATWSGGLQKADLSSDLSCKNFDPKQSDLVVVGAARSRWTAPGIQFDNQVQVLRTPRMVQLDWRRSVLSKQLLPCLRSTVAREPGVAGHVVSVRLAPFPRVATYTRLVRVLLDVDTANGSVRVMVDTLVFGRRSTEITLTTTAPFEAHAVVEAAEARLARRLSSRIATV